MYRTIEDLVPIRDLGQEGARWERSSGEDCSASRRRMQWCRLGLETHVVELAPRLMPVQIDDGGGAALRRRIEGLGVKVHVATETRAVLADDGTVRALQLADGTELALDLVVFSAGIRPRDELARTAGLAIGPRGGIVVDEACRASDPDIFAIGECALARGQIWGLVAPGYAMAKVVAEVLLGRESKFEAADLSTKLKLLGVDVASFGDAHARTPGAQEIVYSDLVSNVYKKTRHLRRRHAGPRWDPGGRCDRIWLARADDAEPDAGSSSSPKSSSCPARRAAAHPSMGVESLPDEAMICSCNTVSKGAIRHLIVERNLTEVGAVKACTRAGTSCGGCSTLVADILHAELKRAGKEVETRLCEHFARVSTGAVRHRPHHRASRSFAELLQRHGKGRGCEICKPAVASMLASVSAAATCSTASRRRCRTPTTTSSRNLQKDGTYSVVPRVPGGEITPEKLIVLGEVARDFGLYTKITGGQRIDMFGARVDQLPQIWRRLVEAGFESGHAYAKALRTVKSCVGSTWCRYGVQDSVRLAIEIELRYRGLRAPHKLKAAVSGCSRECAEAQSKDFGVHRQREGLESLHLRQRRHAPAARRALRRRSRQRRLIRYIDRFLMFYIRTAGRLERTATWLNKRAGGIEELRRILVDDELGVCAQLEAEMAKHIDELRV